MDITSDANEVEACMGPGGIFGNIRGVSKFLTMSNVVASRNIDLLCIEGADFYALLKVIVCINTLKNQIVEVAVHIIEHTKRLY